MDASEMLLAGKDRGGAKYGYGISVTKAIADNSVGYSSDRIRRRRGGGAHRWGVCGWGGACLAAGVIPLRGVCSG